ncbi:uncharacterized protein CEXT_120071 [Caerostris extrusa]|uniref:F-box/LRR-repeat protein n=1 Tax=Caerostris extrusa TaxID=172846 RepID=A0AAV4RG81_CAEEX|nr:uncharacterized protein CEXT_120071 [Caerostris extrusa]
MALPTLQSLCQQQIINAMRMERWDNCSENPFRSMPTKIVNTLVECLYSLPHKNSLSIEESFLLLTSGKIKRLDLRYFKIHKFDEDGRFFCKNICALYYILFNKVNYQKKLREQRYKRAKLYHDASEANNTLLDMVSKDSCQNLHMLILPPFLNFDTSTIVSLIQASPNIEEIHASANIEEIYASNGFDLEVLRNCKELRNLRLHLDIIKFFGDCPDIVVNLLSSLENLETLAVFADLCDSFDYYQLIAKVLLVCPNLISLGLVDSSLALDHIHKEKGIPIQFKLKRCFWGLGSRGKIFYLSQSNNVPIFRKFPNVIETASAMCPLVEELSIQLFHSDSLQHLSLLKRLMTLDLCFVHLNSFYSASFDSFLKEVGHQIKHLSITVMGIGYYKVSISAICNLCVTLETLKINNSVTIDGAVEVCVSPHLKRLCINIADNNCLVFLLENCPNLEELYLTSMLERSLLQIALRKNPLVKLRILWLNHYIPSEDIKLYCTGQRILKKCIFLIKQRSLKCNVLVF